MGVATCVLKLLEKKCGNFHQRIYHLVPPLLYLCRPIIADSLIGANESICYRLQIIQRNLLIKKYYFENPWSKWKMPNFFALVSVSLEIFLVPKQRKL